MVGGHRKRVWLGTVTSTWHEGEHQRGTGGTSSCSRGIWDAPASTLYGRMRIGKQDWLPVIPARLRLLFNENPSVVGAIFEEGVVSTY